MDISESQMQNSNATQLERLLSICIALTSRPSTSSVLRELLAAVKEVTNADGGSLYLLNKDGSKLRAVLVRNDTLKIETDQDSPEVAKSLQIPLLSETGKNLRNLVACAVNNKTLINIADRDDETGFDFSGANKFDQRFGYQSKSFLILPLINSEGRCLGAIQLINARDAQGEVGTFSDNDAQYAQGIASLAATALTNRNTMQDLEQLFEYFAELLALMNDHIAGADSSSGSNALLIALALAKAMHNSEAADFAHFKIGEAVLREIQIAGWLRSWALQHKLSINVSQTCQTDLSALLSQRIEIIRRDLKLNYYESLHNGANTEVATRTLHESLRTLELDWQRVQSSLREKSLTTQELETIGSRYHWRLENDTLPLISPVEAQGLLHEAKSTTPVTDQPDTTRAIIGMLSTLRLPSYLGQALNLANLNSLLDDENEKDPVIFDPNGKLIYSALRISEQINRLLRDTPDRSEVKIQQLLRLLKDDPNLNKPLVELLIQQRVYEPYI